MSLNSRRRRGKTNFNALWQSTDQRWTRKIFQKCFLPLIHITSTSYKVLSRRRRCSDRRNSPETQLVLNGLRIRKSRRCLLTKLVLTRFGKSAIKNRLAVFKPSRCIWQTITKRPFSRNQGLIVHLLKKNSWRLVMKSIWSGWGFSKSAVIITSLVFNYAMLTNLKSIKSLESLTFMTTVLGKNTTQRKAIK